jgi:hypothetical protein
VFAAIGYESKFHNVFHAVAIFKVRIFFASSAEFVWRIRFRELSK